MINDRVLSILLVDDEEIVHQTIAPYLRAQRHEVDSVRNASEALETIGFKDYHLALVDVRMPGKDGLSLLAEFQQLRPELSTVIITGHADMELVIRALRGGAADFLSKPIKLPELDAVLEKASRLGDLKRRESRLRTTISRLQDPEEERRRGRRLVAESPAMKRVLEQMGLAVGAGVETILVTGETGTGKEVVAREIHFLSGQERKGECGPFIAVSCPALPESLAESELFGHVAGAFTGASRDQAGCFELADQGTLFLDEISELSPAVQAKLLRVLETRSVRRIGGARESVVRVRVIAATNRPLSRMVEEGAFRQDLFYRLNVFTLGLDPLRARQEDILPLARHFLEAFVSRNQLAVAGFDAAAREALRAYPWPGNARELRNIVQRAAILRGSGEISPAELSLTPGGEAKPGGAGPPAGASEKERYLAALERNKWNRRQSARELGIPYSTFRYKLKLLGVE